MKRNKKYVIEYRRSLNNLQHPPEKLMKKAERIDEEELEQMENLYGFPHGHNGLSRWTPVTDDLPFGNPYENNNFRSIY